MKKQLQGIALILFGILVILASDWLGHYIAPDVTVPWILIGLAVGIVGIVFAFLKPKNENK